MINRKLIQFFGSKEISITYVTLFLLLIIISGIFIFDNNLLVWDHYGHIQSAQHIIKNMFDYSGWDGSYFNGYPVNYFYPPLLSYLVAITSILLPINLAYKLVSISLIFLTIILFYKFSKLFYTKEHSLLYTLFLTLLFFIPDFIYYGKMVGLGATLWSSLYVGLMPALLGFVILVYFIICFEKKQNVLKLAVLFCLGILSHFIFVVIILYLLINLLIDFKRKSEIILIFIIGSCLSAFWWIPAIIYKEYTVIAYYMLPLVNFTWVLILLSFICILYRWNKIEFKFFKFYFVGMVLFLILILAEKLFINGQTFRVFFVLIFFLSPILFDSLIHFYNQLLKRMKIKSTLTPLFYIFLILIITSSFFIDYSSKTFIEFDIEKLDSNNIFLILGPVEDNIFAHHALFYEFTNNLGGRALRGLFAEQSPNIVFSSGLSLLSNPKEFIWGTIAIKGDQIDITKFSQLMNIMGSTSIISTEGINKNLPVLKMRKIGTQYIKKNENKLLWFDTNKIFEKKDIIEYYFTDSNTIEILNYIPDYYTGTDWIKDNSLYLSKTGKIISLTKITDSYPNNSAKILNYSRKNNHITFFIDSNTNVPILIKES